MLTSHLEPTSFGQQLTTVKHHAAVMCNE